MQKIAVRSLGPMLIAALMSCGNPHGDAPMEAVEKDDVELMLPEPPEGKGALFIIGGGKRPPSLMQKMVDLLPSKDALIAVLPMASSEPDTSAYYGMRQFTELGCTNVCTLMLNADSTAASKLDSLSMADGVYLTGGDQNRLMTSLSADARALLSRRYADGAVIGGSSAGAAVMSSVMITGDQQREPEYESTYSRLMTENGVYSEGLGLFPNAIIDQHFVERSRYNRALTALHDHQMPVFGIGESTALIVSSSGYRVAGDGQVVVFSAGSSEADSSGLIGMENVRLDVWLPGHSTDKN